MSSISCVNDGLFPPQPATSSISSGDSRSRVRDLVFISAVFHLTIELSILNALKDWCRRPVFDDVLPTPQGISGKPK